MRRHKPLQKELGDDVTSFFEASSLATQGTQAPDGIQCMWGASAQRRLTHSFPPPFCPIHKAHYHFKGLETTFVPRILICLTRCFPNSLVHPAHSPEGFRVSLQSLLCPGRQVMSGTGPNNSTVAKSPPYSLTSSAQPGLGLCSCFHPLDLETAKFSLLPRWSLGTVGRELKRVEPLLGFGSPPGRKGC